MTRSAPMESAQTRIKKIRLCRLPLRHPDKSGDTGAFGLVPVGLRSGVRGNIEESRLIQPFAVPPSTPMETPVM
jgi:hypothetical protein